MAILSLRVLRRDRVVNRCRRACSSRGAARVAHGIKAAFFGGCKMTRFRKSALALGLLAAPAAVFAEGEPASALDTALTQLQSGVTSMIDKVAPVVTAIVVALLVLVGIFFAWKYAKKSINKG